jgi:hypothetical protein
MAGPEATLGKAWLGPVAVAVLFFAALAVRAGAGDGFRFERAISAGSWYALPGVLLPGQPVRAGTGYDGQFYFYLAQDPFLRKPATAHALDNTFRVRRILYPLLAWALSLGDRARLPFVLGVINAGAGLGVAALAAWAARRAGRSPWMSLLLVAYPGVWIPVLLDLTEPLQLALLMAGALVSSASLLFLAALAKETAGVALATEAARHALSRDWRRAARHAVLAAVYLGWALFVHAAVTGTHFNDLGAHFLDPPAAPFRLLAQGGARALLLAPPLLIGILAVLRLGVVRDGPTLAGAAYALLALGAGNDTWLDPAAYYRVAAGALALSYLSWCARGDRLGLAALLLGAASGALALPIVLAG